jgi:hypothetical protein
MFLPLAKLDLRTVHRPSSRCNRVQRLVTVCLLKKSIQALIKRENGYMRPDSRCEGDVEPTEGRSIAISDNLDYTAIGALDFNGSDYQTDLPVDSACSTPSESIELLDKSLAFTALNLGVPLGRRAYSTNTPDVPRASSSLMI